MFILRRVLNHGAKIANEWEEHLIKKSNKTFILTDEEFKVLSELPKEYKYEEFDHELYIDRHPSVLREFIDNEDFLQDYEEHLTDKFFVLYDYVWVEYV